MKILRINDSNPQGKISVNLNDGIKLAPDSKVALSSLTMQVEFTNLFVNSGNNSVKYYITNLISEETGITSTPFIKEFLLTTKLYNNNNYNDFIIDFYILINKSINIFDYIIQPTEFDVFSTNAYILGVEVSAMIDTESKKFQIAFIKQPIINIQNVFGQEIPTNSNEAILSKLETENLIFNDVLETITVPQDIPVDIFKNFFYMTDVVNITCSYFNVEFASDNQGRFIVAIQTEIDDELIQITNTNELFLYLDCLVDEDVNGNPELNIEFKNDDNVVNTYTVSLELGTDYSIGYLFNNGKIEIMLLNLDDQVFPLKEVITTDGTNIINSDFFNNRKTLYPIVYLENTMTLNNIKLHLSSFNNTILQNIFPSNAFKNLLFVKLSNDINKFLNNKNKVGNLTVSNNNVFDITFSSTDEFELDIKNDNFSVALDNNFDLEVYNSKLRGKENLLCSSIPVSDEEGIVMYEAKNLIFVNCNNKYEKIIRNLNLRILNKYGLPVSILGEVSMNILFKDENE